MSPRHFARVFRAETGVTPARFVEQARVEEARRRLEESDDGVDEIAADCGFGTPETMRRAFLRARCASARPTTASASATAGHRSDDPTVEV